MAGGLIALLDDIAALTRLAAASADDIAATAGRAGSKTIGVVIDDAAVTPGYVVGLAPERELPIIRKIAFGSLRNKLIFILPLALLLSAFAAWALTPILMVGGLYLCFEGAEKILKAVRGKKAIDEIAAIRDPAELEKRQVGGAIRTDFILSAEIMVITLNELTTEQLLTQAVVLALVGAIVTVAVYGTVAVIVKMDDVGIRLSRSGGVIGMIGRGLLRAMPVLLKALSIVGTAAMLWVGGDILIHGMASFGLIAPEHAIANVSANVGGPGWLVWSIKTTCAAIIGVIVGAVVAVALHLKPNRAPV